MEYKYSLSQENFTIEQIKMFYGFENCNIKMIENNFKCEINGNSETVSIPASGYMFPNRATISSITNATAN